MKRAAKNSVLVFLCFCFIAAALPPHDGALAEGAGIAVSEADRENLERLFAAANPSGQLATFDVGEDIDHVMWVSGFAAGYNRYNADPDSELFEEVPFFSEDAETHFAGLWAAYYHGWEPLDGAVPPADILPCSLDGSVRDSMYYRAENTYMQSLIKEIYGREMAAPEEHVRYYDGYFYFGHIGDREERVWYGYDYAVDTVYDLSNGYYRIVGKASQYDHAEGYLTDAKAYEAIVKKDTAAAYAYFLVAQRFSE